jgi:endoglucanase
MSMFFSMLIGAIVAIMPAYNAKSNPIPPSARETAFRRAKSLNNGVSISWLEQYWNSDVLARNPLSQSDWELFNKLKVQSIRLPVAFEYFLSAKVPVEKVITHIDDVLKQCKVYGIKLIIDYHYGKINDNNFESETNRAINLWLYLTKRYADVSADSLFFEIYNEPAHINPKVWKDAAYNIVTAIRRIDKKRTLLVGASNYNSIYELSRTERLADENIVYTFHFYEPFLFTHQGADWVGEQMATTGIPFPYDAKAYPAINPKALGTAGEANYKQYPTDGNERSVKDKLQIVKSWGDKYYVPLLCSEYGVYRKYTDDASRSRYIGAVRRSLRALGIPGVLWDYNTNFSVFNGPPAIKNLSPSMKKAIDYTSKKQ